MVEQSVDMEKLLKRIGGPKAVQHLASLVAESWPEDFQRLDRSVREKNGPGLKDGAHTMKGNLANLAADYGRKLAADLEQAALRLDWDESERLIAKLRDECSRIQDQLVSSNGGHGQETRLSYRTRARGRVLVVDDDRASRWMAADALERFGHTVLQASSGEECLRVASVQHLEAILLDVVLPGANGYAICRTLKGDPMTETIPVLLLTALDDRNNRLRGIQSGADEFLSKPIDVEELALRVGNAVYSKQLYDQLQDNFRHLQSLESLRDQLSDMLVHDLRTPLTGLIGYGQILSKRAAPKLDEIERESLRQILILSHSMVGMVSDILDVGRLQSDQLPLNLSTVRLEVLARQAAILVGQPGVVVEGEAEVECDAELMQRVLTNLVSNAIKYSPPDGVVSVRISPEEVRVCDQGPGIEPEMRERIFEKYGQAQRKKYSTGLGLAFCKLVIEKHGGVIGVDTGPDGGSEFWFRL